MNTPDEIKVLNKLIESIRKNPDLIHEDSFKTLRDFIESFGGQIHKIDKNSEKIPDELLSEDSQESEIEFENVQTIKKEDIPFPDSGDLSKQVSEDDEIKSSEFRSQGIAKLNNGLYDESLELLTKAVCLNPKSAVNFSKRADCLHRMKRPGAAIEDCAKAININPDSALAYKIRGLSHKLLGNWEKAFQDFQTSNRIDFSEEVAQSVKEIEPMHKRVYEHNQKYERIRRENRIRRAKRAYLKNHSNTSEQTFGQKASAQPSGPGNLFSSLLSDPEIMSSMQDPEVMAALSDIMKNPANFMKYQSNPKFQKIFSKLSGSAGGMPGMANMAQSFFRNKNMSSDDLD